MVLVPSAGPPAGGWMQRAVRVQENSPPPQGPQPAPGRRVHAGRTSYPSIAAPWADGLCFASPEDLPTCFPKEVREPCFSRQLLGLETGDGNCLTIPNALL